MLLVASPFRRVTFPLGVQWSCKPFGELAGHKHGLNFVEVPLTFDLWYPAGTPGARRASGGFEVLRWARGAPAWRPAQHIGFCAWMPARLPAASPTLLCPLVASPRHPPSLAGSPLSGSSASPVFPGAQSARRGRGHPRDPHASPRVQLDPTQKRKLFYCCVQKSVDVPRAPTCPRPSRARVVCWRRSNRRKARTRGCGGRSRTRHRGRHLLPFPRRGSGEDGPAGRWRSRQRGGERRRRAHPGGGGGRYSE